VVPACCRRGDFKFVTKPSLAVQMTSLVGFTDAIMVNQRASLVVILRDGWLTTH